MKYPKRSQYKYATSRRALPGLTFRLLVPERERTLGWRPERKLHYLGKETTGRLFLQDLQGFLDVRPDLGSLLHCGRPHDPEIHSEIIMD